MRDMNRKSTTYAGMAVAMEQGNDLGVILRAHHEAESEERDSDARAKGDPSAWKSAERCGHARSCDGPPKGKANAAGRGSTKGQQPTATSGEPVPSACQHKWPWLRVRKIKAAASGPGRESADTALGTPRTEAANRFAGRDGNGLRRGEGKLVLLREFGGLLGLSGNFAIFAKPVGQLSLSGFLNPLLEQCGDLFADVGGMVQARKLEAFERWIRCFVQVVPWWSDPATRHSQGPLES
jgi:hypothetical protein